MRRHLGGISKQNLYLILAKNVDSTLYTYSAYRQRILLKSTFIVEQFLVAVAMPPNSSISVCAT